MTKKKLIEKLNKEYPKFIKTITNKKKTQKEKREAAETFTEFLEQLADNIPNETQFISGRKRKKK